MSGNCVSRIRSRPIVVLVALLFTSSWVNAADVVFKGVVYEGKGNKLDGADVTIVSVDGTVLGGPVKSGSAVDAAKKKITGGYEIRIPEATFADPKRTVGFVRFEHPDWHIRFVKFLSGKQTSHEINKILPQSSGPEAFVTIIDQIETYRFLYYLETFQGTSVEKLRATYGGRLRSMPDPVRYQGDTQSKVIESMKGDPAKIAALDTELAGLFTLWGMEREAVKPDGNCSSDCGRRRCRLFFGRRR